MVVYRSRAPFRMSFAGGGTDLPSWAKEHGGQVISTTINKYIYTTLVPNGSEIVNVHAYDLNEDYTFSTKDIEYNGEQDLVKAVINNIGIEEGCDLHIHSDLPPGSGMGTSSSLVVSLISVFCIWRNLTLSKGEIAKLACKIEREDLQHAGGYQDQYAAAFGGLNFITFDEVGHVQPITMSLEFEREFNYRLLLCYTGKTHISSELQKLLLKNYGKLEFEEGMNRLKKCAAEMRDILSSNDISQLDKFGELQQEAWIAKKMTSDKVTNADIERLYLHAMKHGAKGGKILGAGGGGHLLLFIDPLKRMELKQILNQMGTEIVPFDFEKGGVISWKSKID